MIKKFTRPNLKIGITGHQVPLAIKRKFLTIFISPRVFFLANCFNFEQKMQEFIIFPGIKSQKGLNHFILVLNFLAEIYNFPSRTLKKFFLSFPRKICIGITVSVTSGIAFLP